MPEHSLWYKHNRHFVHGPKRCHTRDGDYVAMIALDHSRRKLFEEQEMCHSVHFEGASQLVFRLVQNVHVVPNACVVNENRWVSMLLSNLATKLRQSLRGRDIGLVKVYIGHY